MHKLVILIVLILLVVIVLIFLSGWRSDYPGLLDRIPVSGNMVKSSVDFFSQTVPTSIFEMYKSVSRSFGDYGIQIGYKFKNGKLTWEFYTCTSNLDFDHWTSCYNEVFPYGHEFVLPPLKHNEDIYCISMDVNEDTHSEGVVSQLNVYLRLYEKPTFEYTLLPNGVFTLRSKGVSMIPSSNNIAKAAIAEGFDSTSAIALMKWQKEAGWNGKAYGFEKHGREVGLHIFQPDKKTVKAYIETLHSKFSGIKETMLSSISEIVVYFQDISTDQMIVRDGFHIVL